MYFDHPGISQSFLKKVLKNDFSEPKGVTIGSLVDSLIFGQSHNYMVGDSVPQPYFLAFSKVNKEDDYQSKWLEIVRKEKYYDNWGNTTHLKKMEELFLTWEQNKDKKLIDQTDWTTANRIVDYLKNSLLWTVKSKGEIQKELYSTIIIEDQEYELKGLLDIYDNGIIRDLKVTGVKFDMFIKIAKQLRYDVQASFYKELLIRNKLPFIKFEWLVFSIPENRLICIEADENDLIVGEFGNEYIKGWRHALDLWHQYKDIGYFNPLFIGEQTKIKLWQ